MDRHFQTGETEAEKRASTQSVVARTPTDYPLHAPFEKDISHTGEDTGNNEIAQ